MATDLTLDTIKGLGDPDVIESLDYQTIYQAMLETFVALEPEYTLLLESDPVVKVVQLAAYREYLLRHRINEAARASLIAYALGADLDHVAAFYEIVRFPEETDDEGEVVVEEETDEAFRERAILAYQGRSTAGSKYWYESAVRNVDVRVRDVAAHREGTGPDVYLSVLSNEEAFLPSAELLTKIDEAVNNDTVRVISDRVHVQSAAFEDTTISVNFVAHPSAPSNIATLVRQAILDGISELTKLGWDLTLSWITATAHLPEVHSVEVTSPAADVVTTPSQAVSVSGVSAVETGRDY